MKHILSNVAIVIAGVILLPIYWIACIIMGRDVLEYFDK